MESLSEPHHAPDCLAVVQADASSLAAELSGAYRSLVAALPGRPRRPTDIATTLGVNKNVAHRLSTALGKSAPFEILLALPGPAPLAQVAEIAVGKGVDRQVCDAARAAARRYDELIRTVAGDRTSFDAMISDWAPGARVQVDTAARQSVHRGMRQIKGVCADVQFDTFIFRANEEESEKVDLLILTGSLALQRLRPTGSLSVTLQSDSFEHSALSETSRTVLTDYCSDPPPRFRLLGTEERALYTLEWSDTVGAASSRDLVIGELHRKSFRLHRSKPYPQSGAVTNTLVVPSRRFISEILIHRDVYPHAMPTFRVLSCGLRGHADPNDPTRDYEQIHIDCDVQAVSVGRVPDMVTPEVPFMQRMLREQTEAVGWRLDEFRAYRVRIEYPIFDMQMQWVIPLPAPPGAGE